MDGHPTSRRNRPAALSERLTRIARELVWFGMKQASACLFAGSFLVIIALSHVWWPWTHLHRYDGLFLAAIAIQATLLACGLESRREALLILVFHVLATAMEYFKTAVGSWSYPEPAVLRLGGVPLFAGFMYSAVGSYIARIWRIFTFAFTDLPTPRWMLLLSAAIYANFFTHHYLPDGRWLILAVIVVRMHRTVIHFTIIKTHRRMPLLLGLLLVALFIWFAENIATYCRVWFYPSQRHGWTLVSPAKIVAWFLLMFISFSLTALLHRERSREQHQGLPSATAA